MENIAFIYPGQGSQSVGMGKDFIDNFKMAKEMLEEGGDVLRCNLAEILNDEVRVSKTEYTQPCIFLISAMAQAIVCKEFGLESGKNSLNPYDSKGSRISLAFGHSLGEVSAFCLNGGASFTDSILLTHRRGQYMQKACDDLGSEVGMLVCLGLESSKVKDICDEARGDSKYGDLDSEGSPSDFSNFDTKDSTNPKGLRVWAANFNLNNQIVIAGVKSDLESLSLMLKAAGAKRSMLLKISVASHCPLLHGAIEPFLQLLDSKIRDCDVEIISNATLEIYKTKAQALENLTKQLVKPVRYEESVLKARELGVRKFIELGNGNILAGLNNKITDIETISINSSKSLQQLESIFR